MCEGASLWRESHKPSASFNTMKLKKKMIRISTNENQLQGFLNCVRCTPLARRPSAMCLLLHKTVKKVIRISTNENQLQLHEFFKMLKTAGIQKYCGRLTVLSLKAI